MKYPTFALLLAACTPLHDIPPSAPEDVTLKPGRTYFMLVLERPDQEVNGLQFCLLDNKGTFRLYRNQFHLTCENIDEPLWTPGAVSAALGSSLHSTRAQLSDGTVVQFTDYGPDSLVFDLDYRLVPGPHAIVSTGIQETARLIGDETLAYDLELTSIRYLGYARDGTALPRWEPLGDLKARLAAEVPAFAGFRLVGGPPTPLSLTCEPGSPQYCRTAPLTN